MQECGSIYPGLIIRIDPLLSIHAVIPNSILEYIKKKLISLVVFICNKTFWGNRQVYQIILKNFRLLTLLEQTMKPYVSILKCKTGKRRDDALNDPRRDATLLRVVHGVLPGPRNSISMCKLWGLC